MSDHWIHRRMTIGSIFLFYIFFAIVFKFFTVSYYFHSYGYIKYSWCRKWIPTFVTRHSSVTHYWQHIIPNFGHAFKYLDRHFYSFKFLLTFYYYIDQHYQNNLFVSEEQTHKNRRTYLNVNYHEKNHAKSLGAQRDTHKRKWYAPMQKSWVKNANYSTPIFHLDQGSCIGAYHFLLWVSLWAPNDFAWFFSW